MGFFLIRTFQWKKYVLHEKSVFSTPLNSYWGVDVHLDVLLNLWDWKKVILIVLKLVRWHDLLLTEMCGKSPTDFCGCSVKFCVFLCLHASAFSSLAKFQSCKPFLKSNVVFMDLNFKYPCLAGMGTLILSCLQESSWMDRCSCLSSPVPLCSA